MKNAQASVIDFPVKSLREAQLLTIVDKLTPDQLLPAALGCLRAVEALSGAPPAPDGHWPRRAALRGAQRCLERLERHWTH